LALIGVSHAEEPRQVVNSLGMRFVHIPPGEFQMGSPADDEQAEPDERPQHAVRIATPIYLGACEVTQREFERVMSENPSWFSPAGGGRDLVADVNTSRLPVEMISWDDAVRFCERLGDLPEERAAGRTYRLPTEAEWEHAARAGSATRYAFGDELTANDANVSSHTTRPVGFYPPNAWSLHDMHGNVWEWCGDWYDAEAYANNSAAATGPGRVVRGGDYRSDPRQSRSANRDFTRPTRRDWGNGFRVVMMRETK
jgi:formylglycine-generating enzyme required for sulfatase activity